MCFPMLGYKLINPNSRVFLFPQTFWWKCVPTSLTSLTLSPPATGQAVHDDTHSPHVHLDSNKEAPGDRVRPPGNMALLPTMALLPSNYWYSYSIYPFVSICHGVYQCLMFSKCMCFATEVYFKACFEVILLTTFHTPTRW